MRAEKLANPSMNQTKAMPDEFKYGTIGDEFKPLGEVLLSDVRQTCWVRMEPGGTSRGLQIKDLHTRMSELSLNSTVPEKVCTGFDTARNLFLYSWFVYRFQTVAELQAYATLEFALGKRLEAEGIGHIQNLSPRLKFAVKNGWLRADGVRIYRQKAEGPKEICATTGAILQRVFEA
jgi:hypothetical protein